MEKEEREMMLRFGASRTGWKAHVVNEGWAEVGELMGLCGAEMGMGQLMEMDAEGLTIDTVEEMWEGEVCGRCVMILQKAGEPRGLGTKAKLKRVRLHRMLLGGEVRPSEKASG